MNERFVAFGDDFESVGFGGDDVDFGDGPGSVALGGVIRDNRRIGCGLLGIVLTSVDLGGDGSGSVALGEVKLDNLRIGCGLLGDGFVSVCFGGVRLGINNLSLLGEG